MVATQLRHVDDPDRLPQPPIPPLCEAQPHLHATLPCPRSFARAAICGGGAVGLCIAVQPCSRSFVCAAIPKMQPRATSTPNRPEPSPLSPAENRRYAAPRPPAGARSSTPSRKALSSTPPRRQPATCPPTPLTFGAQPTAPPSRIANGQRSQPSTRPGFRTSHRPPVRPVTNAVAFGQLRAQRCRSRLALPGASPTASALPAADLPNTGTPPPASAVPPQSHQRKRRPPRSQAISTPSLPTNAPSHPTRHRPPPMPRPTRRHRDGRRGRRSWPADAPSV